MKILEKIVDVVFSFPTFMILFSSGIIYALFMVGQSEISEKRLLEKQTAYCYSLGMVVVETDAGRRCVAPESLTVIK